MNNQIYTASKVADILEVNVRTVRDLLKAQELKGYKKLGRWYVLHSAIIEYLKE